MPVRARGSIPKQSSVDPRSPPGGGRVDPAEGHVNTLGFNLFYRSYGTPVKGTVLCLHGGPGATHDYLLSLEDLAQFGYRAGLMDQLGRGTSDRPSGTATYTMPHHVAAVE